MGRRLQRHETTPSRGRPLLLFSKTEGSPGRTKGLVPQQPASQDRIVETHERGNGGRRCLPASGQGISQHVARGEQEKKGHVAGI